MAAATMLLSMGAYLHVDGHRTHVPLPFIVLAHLPLLDSGSASRYVSLFWLFAALILVMTLDWVHRTTMPRFGAVGSAAVCLTVGAVALVPLVPAWPYPASAAAVPRWFTSNARALPTGTTVVVFPSSNPSDSSAMLWQAMSNMTFRMPGGYAVFASSPGSRASFYAAPSVLETAMTACVIGAPPEITPETTRSTLHDWKASHVVVVPGTAGAACATNLFDEALGAHRTVGGVSVWSTGVAG